MTVYTIIEKAYGTYYSRNMKYAFMDYDLAKEEVRALNARRAADQVSYDTWQDSFYYEVQTITIL